MATEEITISELELADEVLADMVMAVETASDTKAITLKQLKAYLGSNLPTGFILPAVGRISDERFTLLDGKTLAKAGGYEAFYNKAQSEVEKGNWYACTEEEFNADVAKYGQCGRFVLTAEYVRIPKITRFLGATVTLSEIGKTYAESLPNIKGTRQEDTVQSKVSGAYSKSSKTSTYGTSTGSLGYFNVEFDASRSSTVYQDGAKVQPDHTKYPYYMVVSTEGQTAPIEVDINKVYEDLELKANKDLTNVNPAQSFKDMSIGWGMPDFEAKISIGATIQGQYNWTEMPSYGIVFAVSQYQGSAPTIHINNNPSDENMNVITSGFAIVEKGKYVSVAVTNGGTAYFVPFKGVN